MYCPNCNKVIKTTDTVCPDCGFDLTDTDTMLDAYSIRLEAMKPVKLTTVFNNYDSGIILNLLKNNDIPCIKKDQFTGGYMNLLMGYSVYGQDIYVDEGDYDKALELLQILESTSDADEDPYSFTSEENTIEATDIDTPDREEEAPLSYPVFYKNPTIVARIILGFMVAGIIAALIINSL